MSNWLRIPGKILSAPLHHLNVETDGIHRRTQADWQTDGYWKSWTPFSVIELLKGLVLSSSKCAISENLTFLRSPRIILSRLVWMQFFKKFYNFCGAELPQLFPKHHSWSVWISKHWSIDAIPLPSALPPFFFHGILWLNVSISWAFNNKMAISCWLPTGEFYYALFKKRVRLFLNRISLILDQWKLKYAYSVKRNRIFGRWVRQVTFKNSKLLHCNRLLIVRQACLSHTLALFLRCACIGQISYWWLWARSFTHTHTHITVKLLCSVSGTAC
jgi:hypothetical protein